MDTELEDYDGDQPVPLNPRRMARLRSMHTRQLLSLLRGTYGRSSWWENWEAENFDDPTEAEIKAVLRTREHIPNKQEGEKARKAKAKTRREGRNNRYVMRRR
jgi:hypothetical protein